METEILELVVKVLNGEACLEEKQRLISWLGKDQENMKAFRQAESIWNAMEIMASGKEFNTVAAFDRFKEMAQKRTPVRKRIPLRRTAEWFIRIAAILIIVAGLSYLMLSDRHGKNASAFVCEVVAPRGSKAQVVLPDGTRVWLNAESKLNYNNDFNRNSRDVYLEGEGYFEVTKNHLKPFVVNTADIKIRALGTTFNVKSYPGEKTVETTLIEGKVVLEKLTSGNKRENLLTLKPNQRVIYYKDSELNAENLIDINRNAGKSVTPIKSPKSQIILNDKVNPEHDIAWKNNRLYFEDVSFQDLAVKLERRFGVTIHFMNEEIKQYPFSGRFDDIIIEQVLEALQFASPFYYKIIDKDIYISDKPIKDMKEKNTP